MRSNKEYWEETLERYRVSKRIREIRKKFKIPLKGLVKEMDYSKQYINNVQEIIIKPNREFINKLEDLEGNKK